METKGLNRICRNNTEHNDEYFNDVVLGGISRYYVCAIIDAIWNDENGLVKLENARMFLEDQYIADEYRELAGSIRTLYVMYDVDVPDIIDALMRSESVELLEVFFGLFLFEFSEMINAYRIANGEDN